MAGGQDHDAAIDEGADRQVDACLDRYLGPESESDVGLAVALVVDGRARFRCRGTADPARDEPITPATLFEVGSITELLTATALADLALGGTVDLDDPVARYLPEEAAPRTRDGAAVTLRHLAARTSGLPRLPDNLGGAGFDPANPYAHYTRADLFDALGRATPAQRPGLAHSESSLGFAALGHALAAAAGVEVDRLLVDRVAAPLGMVDTVVAVDAERSQRLAVGHAEGEPVPGWEMPALAAAGGLKSTAADLARFVAAALEPDSAGPLGPALALTQRLHAGGEPPRTARRWGLWLLAVLACWFAIRAVFEAVAPGHPEWLRLPATLVAAVWLGRRLELRLFGRLRPMGLGWRVDPLSGPSGRALWCVGGTGGFAGFVGLAPGSDVGVVVLASSELPDRLVRDLGFELLLAAAEQGRDRRAAPSTDG